MRAGLYARVSSEEQAEGYSIDAQLEAMRQFCQDRGWAVVREYIDLGVSGTIKERPQFSAALRDCEAGKLDVLVTHKLDRLFRNIKELLNTVEDDLERWGVAYVSVVENVDRSTPHGKLLFNQLASVAQYFSDNLGTEVAKGKYKRAKAGLSNAQRPAYGYRRVGSEDEPDVVVPEDAEIVLRAFHLYAAGNHSFQSLITELNPLTPEKRWTRRTVAAMLTNPVYTGKVRYHGELYEGQHEPIVPQWLFDKVQQVRLRRGVRRDKPTSRRVHLLAGIVTCRDCGRPMHGASNTKRRRGETEKHRRYYYRDSAKTQGLKCPHAGRHVHASIVDQQVIEIVKQVRLPDDWQAQIVEVANYPAERDKIERQRHQFEARLARQRDLYELGDLERDEYLKRRNEIMATLADLTIPDEPATVQAGEYLESLAGLWDDLTRIEQREVLHVIFADVLLDVGERRVIAVKPNRDFMILFRFDDLKEGKDGYFYITRGQETS